MVFQFTFNSSIPNPKPISLLRLFLILYLISIVFAVIIPLARILFIAVFLYVLYLIDKQFISGWDTRRDLVYRIEQLEAQLSPNENTTLQNTDIN